MSSQSHHTFSSRRLRNLVIIQTMHLSDLPLGSNFLCREFGIQDNVCGDVRLFYLVVPFQLYNENEQLHI